MTYFELFLLALGLCFDTFAVTLSGGICMNIKFKCSQIVKIILCFAIFQAGFTLIGWVLGFGLSTYINKFDHWIAFILLSYIGGKMILESIKKGETCYCDEGGKTNLLSLKQLVLLSIATSIDALAVGISIALIKISSFKVAIGIVMIFGVTAIAAYAGLLSGSRVGVKFGKRSELIGGIILIAIGIKILVEHLFS